MRFITKFLLFIFSFSPIIYYQLVNDVSLFSILIFVIFGALITNTLVMGASAILSLSIVKLGVIFFGALNNGFFTKDASGTDEYEFTMKANEIVYSGLYVIIFIVILIMNIKNNDFDWVKSFMSLIS